MFRRSGAGPGGRAQIRPDPLSSEASTPARVCQRDRWVKRPALHLCDLKYASYTVFSWSLLGDWIYLPIKVTACWVCSGPIER